MEGRKECGNGFRELFEASDTTRCRRRRKAGEEESILFYSPKTHEIRPKLHAGNPRSSYGFFSYQHVIIQGRSSAKKRRKRCYRSFTLHLLNFEMLLSGLHQSDLNSKYLILCGIQSKCRWENSGLTIFDNDDPTGPWLKMADSCPPSLAKVLSHDFFNILYVCHWIHRRTFFRKQNDERASKLNIIKSLGLSTGYEKNKFWNLFWKSWPSLISDSVCAHN